MRHSLAALSAVLALAASARSADDVPPKTDAAPRFIVLVISHTQKGANHRTLEELGINRYRGSRFFGPHEESLRRALGLTDIYAPLLAPTLCPGARIADPCPALRVIDDVKLPEAIAALKPSRIVLIGAHAGYYEKDRSFSAGWFAHVLDEDGHRVNTFRIRFFDWNCDVSCVQTSYPAAAYELAAMFRYMLETDIGYRSNALPVEWREKSQPKDFAQWSNGCIDKEQFDRVVRQYGLRLWLTPIVRHSRSLSRSQLPYDITLESLSWRGCNTVDGL